MAQVFTLPDLGEGIHEGEVVAVLVAVGDQVVEGQPILEVETDKARVEIPSPFTGTVREINVKAGELVKVGHVLMVFADAGEDVPPIPAVEPPPAGIPAAQPPPEPLPQPAAAQPALEPALEPATAAGSIPVPAAPSTRRLARELGVDLQAVTATGAHGLVTADDVRAFAEGLRAAPPSAREAAAEAVAPTPPGQTLTTPALPDFTRWGSVERVPLRSVRRATARHLALAWAQVPHVNHQDAADITRLDELRRRHKADIEALGGKLTLTVFVLKAAVAALKKHPRVNASLDMSSAEIILKHYYHLGVAVDTERGLVVPVLRDVDCKSITDLAIELNAVGERTRSGQVTPEDLQGGTFTITNIGALGGTGFAPLVDIPQVAILGTGRARLQAIVTGTPEAFTVTARLVLPLVLAFDHRVMDGADAARFVNLVIDELQDPEKLLLM